MNHPILQDAQQAMLDAIIYSADPLASVLASRLVILEARFAGESALVRAYGWEWESLLGILRLAETVTEDEEAILSDRLSLRQRRLGKIAVDWLNELGRDGIRRDLFEDLDRLAGEARAERTVTALRNAVLAGLLHRDTGPATPITVADENELTQPIHAVLVKSRREPVSASKAKGTTFETLMTTFLAWELKDDRIERRALTGSNDRGDIAGVRVGPYRMLALHAASTPSCIVG